MLTFHQSLLVNKTPDIRLWPLIVVCQLKILDIRLTVQPNQNFLEAPLQTTANRRKPFCKKVHTTGTLQQIWGQREMKDAAQGLPSNNQGKGDSLKCLSWLQHPDTCWNLYVKAYMGLSVWESVRNNTFLSGSDSRAINNVIKKEEHAIFIQKSLNPSCEPRGLAHAEPSLIKINWEETGRKKR